MNELDKAVVAAQKMYRNHEEVHRIMYPHSDKDKLWREATDHACVMARFILDNLRILEDLKEGTS